MIEDQFDSNKEKIINTLLKTYNGIKDLSPKGFVDTPVIDILDIINSHNDYISTSSCSGRIAVYQAVKDKGVNWLLVKHSPVKIDEVINSINSNNNNNNNNNNIEQDDDDNNNNNNKNNDNNFLMLKCESFILHILCRDIQCAKSLLNIALECGYRESGITIGKGSKVMIAIRTTAFGLEVPIAINSSKKKPEFLFTNHILSLIIKEANKKLLLNFSRIDNFLMKLKNIWGWPKIYLSNQNNICKRWGHSCIMKPDLSSYVIYGGYGIDNNNLIESTSSEKSSRKLHNTVINNNILDRNITPIINILNETNSMHSVVQLLIKSKTNEIDNFSMFYIVSGGRISPSISLPCLCIYDNNFKKVSFVEEGEIPNPRWGHSLTRFSSNDTNINTYFLFGGRDTNNIYGDAYTLTCHFDSDIIHCTWTKIWEKNENISARFFHASVGIPDSINNSDHISDKSNTNMYKNDESFDMIEVIIIHGGLLQLDNPITDSEFLLIKPNTYQVVKLIINTSIPPISRFAHTLTYVGKNSVFLVGGTSFQDDTNDFNNNLTDSYCIDFVRLIGDDNDVTIRGEIQPLNIYNSKELPCAQCRCHHQSIYSEKSKELHLIGGGQLCLGFGGHYCQSISLKLTHNYDQNHIFDATTTIITKKNASKNLKNKDKQNLDNKLVIFVSTNMVKRTKTFLEVNNFFDKTRRIAPIDNKMFSASGMFAVPVKNRLIEAIQDKKLNESSMDELAICIGNSSRVSEIIPIEVKDATISTFDDLNNRCVLLYGYQTLFFNKAITGSSYRKVLEYLENKLSSYSNINNAIKSEMLATLPKKFEFVGDILMIAPETFNSHDWELLFKNEDATVFWKGLAECFGLERVAKKSKIDSGPKRESKVVMLLPPCGQPIETGPTSQGWVTVTDNNIQYSFDITRVMFCSGNITEKIRMGKESCAGQIIVDLYCGIGYYTLPFLIHGNAAHVYACEWNSNSVLALKENLKNNKVHSSRYTIYENDNRITAPLLRDLADRICLGLLPSSEQGWPLAAIALKPSGGILHVHENVNDDNINNFSDYLVQKMIDFFLNENKSVDIKIIKIEKVKSYAPHILHIVFDLLVTPKVCDLLE